MSGRQELPLGQLLAIVDVAFDDQATTGLDSEERAWLAFALQAPMGELASHEVIHAVRLLSGSTEGVAEILGALDVLVDSNESETSL